MEDEEKKKRCKKCIPTRYILAVLGFTGITLQYILKVNLSVAIVAMVGTSEGNNSVSVSETCPRESRNYTEEENENDDEFDWDHDLQSLLLSSYFYGYVATQLVGGYVSQRFGGRLVFGPGVLITGVLSLLTAVVARSSVTGLMVLRVLEGCASGLIIPSMQSLFSRWYPPQERQLFSGIIFSAINFGNLAGMGLSGLLIGWGGWPAAFYVSGALAVVWFVPWLFLAYDTPQLHPYISSDECEYILAGLGKDIADKNKSPDRVPWLHILASPPVWAGILMQTGCAWVLYTLLNELPTYLSNVLHYNVRDSGVISSIPHLFAWITSSTAGGISQWLRNKGYLSHFSAYKVFNGLAALGQALCFMVITLVGCNSESIVAMFIVTMLFNGFFFGGSYLNHVDLAPNHAGTISGILHTVVNTPGFITPIVTGAIVHGEHTQTNWHTVFYVAIGVSLSTYIFYVVFGSVKEQYWNNLGMRETESDKLNSDRTTSLDMEGVQR